jgi:hypothetical protein
LGADVHHAPLSGLAGDEYFTISNPHPFAIDLSDWQVQGATTFGIRPGTVIPAAGTLYLTRSSAQFRSRAASPAGGEGLLVQQYASELPDSGGTLQLVDGSGRVVSEVSFGNPALPANANNLRVSEVNYNPRDGVAAWGELPLPGANFEFLEVTNISAQPIELAGVRLMETTVGGDTLGISFHFASQVLPAGQSLVVVKQRAAFESRYGNQIAVAIGDDGQGGLDGEFGGQLSNQGETLTLVGSSGQLIQQLAYDDQGPWPGLADGSGSSLEWIGSAGDPNVPSAWSASNRFGGSPGATYASSEPMVVINELRANSLSPAVDAIELFNRSAQAIDVSGWFLSDSIDNPWKYSLPAGSVIAAGGWLVLDQNQFQFNLRSDEADNLLLIAVDPSGRPVQFADYVEFGPTLSNQSLGRFPDGEGSLRPLTSASFGQSNQSPIGGLPGDFTADGVLDGADLALLCAAIRAGEHASQYELTGDDRVDLEDLDFMVHDLLKSRLGDANLDGRFDSNDLVLVFQSGSYEDTVEDNAAWASGDWNCDGDFDSSDLVAAWAEGGYEGT